MAEISFFRLFGVQCKLICATFNCLRALCLVMFGSVAGGGSIRQVGTVLLFHFIFFFLDSPSLWSPISSVPFRMASAYVPLHPIDIHYTGIWSKAGHATTFRIQGYKKFEWIHISIDRCQPTRTANHTHTHTQFTTLFISIERHQRQFILLSFETAALFSSRSPHFFVVLDQLINKQKTCERSVGHSDATFNRNDKINAKRKFIVHSWHHTHPFAWQTHHSIF